MAGFSEPLAGFVIPGWSEGPDPESRDSGFASSTRPGMTNKISDPLAPIAPALPHRNCDARSAALAHLHVANWHEVADTGLPSSTQPRQRLRGLAGAPADGP